MLAEGTSIRATGRQVEVDKDTVNHWLPILGRHCQGVMNYFFRNLHLEECQLDELWPFIYKKERQLTALEKLAETYGDAWVWIAFSPICKLVPAWVVGKRTLPHARRLVFRLKSATDGQIPFFTSDELPHYAEALLEVYGEQIYPSRNGTRGRFPKPYRVPLPAYVMQSWSKSVSKVASLKSAPALCMAQPNKLKQRYRLRLSAIQSTLMA